MILEGYWQSWRYFAPQLAALRSRLAASFRPDIAYQCSAKIREALFALGKARRSALHIVGIHVRRGDFTRASAQEYPLFVPQDPSINWPSEVRLRTRESRLPQVGNGLLCGAAPGPQAPRLPLPGERRQLDQGPSSQRHRCTSPRPLPPISPTSLYA